MPCAKPDGPTIGQSGPVPHKAPSNAFSVSRYAGPTTEFLDKVYPASVFGETFNRKQVAWIMAVFFLEEVLEKFWLSSKINF